MTNTQTTNLADTESIFLSDNIDTPTNNSSKEGEKLFTQQQLEAFIAERIKRERKMNESLIPVKQLIKTLASREEFKGKSYSDIAKNLVKALSEKSVKEESVKDVCGNTAETQAKTDSKCATKMENAVEEGIADAGSDAALQCGTQNNTREDFHGEENDEKEGNYVSEEAVEKTSVEKQNEQTDKPESQNTNNTLQQIEVFCAFKEKYPDADMNKLFDSNLFKSFAKGKNQSLLEICEEYCDFLSAFEEKGNHKSDNAFEASIHGQRQASPMLSTAFSSHSATSNISDGLTKQQMEIAKSAGLSYREYAELLSSIPKSPKRALTD